METSNRSTNVTRRIVITISAIIVIVVVLYFTLTWLSNFLPEMVLPKSSISYLVEGTAENAVITYTKSDGKVSEPQSIDIPWHSRTYTIPSRTLVILTAAATESGTIKCTILMGNTVIDSNTQDPFEDKALCGGYIK